jgi:thioesterase domain-containing protein
LTRFDDMAAAYVREIQAVLPHGPYLLCGYSIGGLLAWEVAQHLHAQNQKVALLALVDTPLDLNPNFRPVAQSSWEFFTRKVAFHLEAVKESHLPWRFFTRKVAFHVDAMKESHLPWPSYVARRLKARWRRLHSAVPGRRRGELEKLDPEPRPWWWLRGDEPEKWPASLLTMVETNSRAGREYRLRKYPGRVNLFLAHESEFRRYDHRLPGWLAAGGVEIRWAPGNHASMLFEPYVGVLAKTLRRCIDKAILPAPHRWDTVRRRVTSRPRFSGGAR